MDIEEINKTLHKVKLRVKKNWIYLRATLPPKPGHDRPKQYELSTGLPNTFKGRQAAKGKAQQLESNLIFERFDWSNWGVDVKNDNNETVAGDWIERFEEDYWNRKLRTRGSAANYKTDYGTPFAHLPVDEPLTLELLQRIATTHTAPTTRTRKRFCMAYGALARFAGLKPGSVLTNLAKGYEPKRDRVIPSDDEIAEYYNAIRSPAWQWVYGVLALYGLRPHEVFRADYTRLKESPPVVWVFPNTKSKERLVYPVGAKTWDWDCTPQWPNVDLTRPNRALGGSISASFKDYDIPFIPYALRDAYALRCARFNINDTVAAKWMGHSLTVHYRDYAKWLNERDFNEVWHKAQI